MKKLYTVTTHRTKDGGGTEDQPTTFSYDLMGRPTQVLFPDETDEFSTYEFGQLKTWKTRKNQTKTLVYDAPGRELSHSWNDGVTPAIARSWDDANRLTSITNIFSSVDFAYDDAGQVIWEGNEIAGSGGRTQANYFRYPDGSVAHLYYPGGTYLRKDYTARGQLAAVGWDDGENNWWKKLTAYTYLPDGKVDKVDYGNGTTTDLDYNGRGFIDSVLHRFTGSGAVFASHVYTRDTRDRIATFQKQNGRGDRFLYDGEGQLTDAWYNAPDPAGAASGWTRRHHFDYDALGNRQGSNNNVASRNAGTTPVTFSRRDNGLNQYSSWSPSIIYHDDNYPGWSAPGNGVMMAEGWITASYSALNQPVAIWSPAYAGTPNLVWFGYDPLGRCVKRWVGDSGDIYSNPATYFHYDGWNLLQEGSNAWGPSRVYAHGNRVDEIVWSYNTFTGEQAFHNYDARGHCTFLTGSTGNILEQYEYDAFGQPCFFNSTAQPINFSTVGNRFLFTGREYLSELKLYDYRHRMYQPELGRFLQPDPKQFAAGDYNLYRYCHNDPVNRSDPLGLEPLAKGLLDVPKNVLKNAYDNAQKAATETLKDTNRRTQVEHRIDGYRDKSGNVKSTDPSKGSKYPSPQAPAPKLPAGVTEAQRVSQGHSHVGSPAVHYGGDKASANDVGNPKSPGLLPLVSAVGTTIDGGARQEFYIPSANQAERAANTGGAYFFTRDGVNFNPAPYHP